MKKSYYIVLIMFSISITIFGINDSFGDSEKIPSWIKLTAEFWVNEQVSDEEFISVLQYLIDEKILQVPTTEEKIVTPNEDTTPNPAYIQSFHFKDNLNNILIRILFWDDSGKTPSLGIPLSPSGDLTIEIISDAKTIFKKNISVSEDDFEWKPLDDGDTLSFTYTIPSSEIQKSAIPDGEILIVYETDSLDFRLEQTVDFLTILSPEEISDNNYQENAVFMDECVRDGYEHYSCDSKQQTGRIIIGINSIGKYTLDNETYLRIDFEIENEHDYEWSHMNKDLLFNPQNFEKISRYVGGDYMFNSVSSSLWNDTIETGSSYSGILLLGPISEEFKMYDGDYLRFNLYHEGIELDMIFDLGW